MRRFAHPALAAVLVSAAFAAMGLAGCQQLFTTSLGASLKRTTLTIPKTLTAAQAADLAAQAKDNAKLAEALTASLVAQLGAAPDPATDASLMGSAAGAAIVASGASPAVSDLITAYVKTQVVPDATTLTALLATIQDGAAGDGVVTALSYLADLTPEQAQAAGLGATDLAIAAIVVLSSVLPPGDPSSLDLSIPPYSTNPEVVAAQQIFANAQTLAGDDPTGIFGFITGSFSL